MWAQCQAKLRAWAELVLICSQKAAKTDPRIPVLYIFPGDFCLWVTIYFPNKNMLPCMFCFPNFCRKSNKSGYSYALMLASIQALCSHKNWVSARNSYFTPFRFPPVPANPPACWRTIVSCRKKKANEIRHVLPPQYQAATTHSTTLSILPTFQSQKNVISTMQGFPVEWLNFGDGTGQLTA